MKLSYFSLVLGLLLALICSNALAAGNPGISAMECVSASRDKDDVVFKNKCDYKVFVVYCGDMKYSKKKCGDGPKGNSFFTHSTNIGSNESSWARSIKEYKYAACEGQIGFGKDEIQDSPDGSFSCVASKSRSGVQAEKEAKGNRRSTGDRQSNPQQQANKTAQNIDLPMDTSQPQLTLSPTPDCPPGSSPARHANGTYVTVPPSGICIKNEDHTPGLDDLRSRIGGSQPASQQVVGGTTTLGNSNGLTLKDINPNCNQPGREYAIGCVETKCQSGQVKVNGKCVNGISCIPPSVLKNGKCVSSAEGNGSSGGTGNSGSEGRDAAKCVVVRAIPAKGYTKAHQAIVNTCNEKIGLLFCHNHSSMPGTRDTECGQKNRYFQQQTTLDSGEIKDNQYSIPPDATIEYGACFGGQGKIKQTTSGQYICR